MKSSHLEILQHAIGADQYGQMPKHGESRNYYGTDAEDADCLELVAAGYMVQLPARSWIPDTMFAVTKTGQDAMREAIPKPPKVSASTKRFAESCHYGPTGRAVIECPLSQQVQVRGPKGGWKAYKD